MLIAMDHGNKQTKLVRSEPFISGLSESEVRPFGTDVLKYRDKYYQISDQRIPYHRDKTEDDRFFVLTLFKIAKEIEAIGACTPGIIRVQLAIGLPPAHYGASTEVYTAVLEYAGQIVRMEISNKSLSTGVSILKTGPKEAIAGQPVRYVFSKIGNTSNVMLQSFYWRDALPAEVRLERVVTGTYNFPGVYKIVYKVNNTGEYRTLADSLSTGQNYDLIASPAALGLAANERVTEIMFAFGQVPGGFAQGEKSQIKCTAVAGLAAGSSFVNIADVGGTHNGVWVQAISRWATTVYGKPTPLPKTGY